MRERLTRIFASRWGIILVGGIIGLLGVILQRLGNPPNMGICISCFERDMAGAVGLHTAPPVRYMRPEVPAFVLGSLLAAILFREFRSRAGAAPVTRFMLGVFAMIGTLVFLGCPWRVLFRLGGGDLNATVGLAGLVTGIVVGIVFFRRGFTLGRPRPGRAVSGLVLPGLMLGVLVLAIVAPSLFSASTKGPGAMHAPILISIGAGLLIGVLAQRTRFCTVGSIRNVILARSAHLLLGVIALVVVVFGGNLVLGKLTFGFEMQPVAHSQHLWNYLGMVLGGLCFVMAGGCPGRQLILAGEGDGGAVSLVTGMIVGAGFVHRFGLGGVPDRMVDGVLKTGGPGLNGQVAVLLGLAFCVAIGFLKRERRPE